MASTLLRHTSAIRATHAARAFYSRVTGLDSAAEAHYPTMTFDAIKALDIALIAADDAALFLWATVPMLPQALEVMAAWGFVYKTHIAWVKDKDGTGYWFRNKHPKIGPCSLLPAYGLPGAACAVLRALQSEASISCSAS
jgi:hypothetical protein